MSWLAEYCDPGWEPAHLAERLAMTGTEVERVGHVGAPAPEGFVLGRVEQVDPHPDADRLRVCTVDTGELRTIVCGAANVAAGQFVAVALPGAVLPGGQKLGKAKLRGIESDGMILSETEMEIGDDAEGIAVLAEGEAGPGGAVAGTPLADVLPVSEPVLELEVTPNRPDCLGIYGVAREVHAISGAELADAPWEQDAKASGRSEIGKLASVRVEVPELCPRFTARAFEGLTVGPSPLWLKARLAAAGQRPINNVVDITNYVMLMTAQPLHAFDLDAVPGGELVVRRAEAGETMTTLDGAERTFDTDTVLVCDRTGPSGIAGVMGGARSEVSATTTRVLLEVATWNGPNILRTSRNLALRSEASARFEKQLHPALAMRAQHVASRLLVELCGATLVPGTIDEYPDEPAPRSVAMRVGRVGALVGLDVPAATCVERLRSLGFETTEGGGTINAVVPPDRDGDVQREVDLIEEVARLADLNENLVGTLPVAAGRAGGLEREQRLRRRAEDVLCDLGFDEIVSWSFGDASTPDRLRLPAGDLRRDAITLANPLSSEQSLLRTTLLGGLLDAAALNAARGTGDVALFESSRVYLPAADPGPGELGGEFRGHRGAPATEPHKLAAVISGEAPPTWRGDPRSADFHSLMAALQALAAHLGAGLSAEAGTEPFLHPGRSAALACDSGPLGWIGEVHPLVARAWDLDRAVAFEIDLATLIASAAAGEEPFEDLTSHPALHQDIAVVVDEDTGAEAVRRVVLEAGGELLREAGVFDVYRGDQIGAGRKSLALRLSFRAAGRTLSDEEIAAPRDAIAAALAEIGGTFRG